MYGVPINLTYKSDDTYKTFHGGIATILSRLAIVAFFCTHINLLVQKKNEIKR